MTYCIFMKQITHIYDMLSVHELLYPINIKPNAGKTIWGVVGNSSSDNKRAVETFIVPYRTINCVVWSQELLCYHPVSYVLISLNDYKHIMQTFMLYIVSQRKISQIKSKYHTSLQEFYNLLSISFISDQMRTKILCN